MTTSKFLIKDLIAEVDYELSQRQKVYKALIDKKKLSRPVAEDHYRKMQAVKRALIKLSEIYKEV